MGAFDRVFFLGHSDSVTGQTHEEGFFGPEYPADDSDSNNQPDEEQVEQEHDVEQNPLAFALSRQSVRCSALATQCRRQTLFAGVAAQVAQIVLQEVLVVALGAQAERVVFETLYSVLGYV